jgi:hypothetical protein
MNIPSYMMTPKAEFFYANIVHARIKSQIDEVAKKIKDGQSLLVEFPLNDGRIIIPQYIGFQNPNFILVYGQDANGNEIKALLPHTNIQLVITVLNKPSDKKPIGFQNQE